jgi:hypothetical protein
MAASDRPEEKESPWRQECLQAVAVTALNSSCAW